MFVVACDAAVGNSSPSTTKSFQFYTVISTLTSTLTNSVTESQPPFRLPPRLFLDPEHLSFSCGSLGLECALSPSPG